MNMEGIRISLPPLTCLFELSSGPWCIPESQCNTCRLDRIKFEFPGKNSSRWLCMWLQQVSPQIRILQWTSLLLPLYTNYAELLFGNARKYRIVLWIILLLICCLFIRGSVHKIELKQDQPDWFLQSFDRVWLKVNCKVYCNRMTNLLMFVKASADSYKYETTLYFPLSERKLTMMGYFFIWSLKQC